MGLDGEGPWGYGEGEYECNRRIFDILQLGKLRFFPTAEMRFIIKGSKGKM